jgi:hypothetical protein
MEISSQLFSVKLGGCIIIANEFLVIFHGIKLPFWIREITGLLLNQILRRELSISTAELHFLVHFALCCQIFSD